MTNLELSESDTRTSGALLIPLQDETYAVALDQVVEVVPNPLIAPLPATPASLLGVFNFRGEIVPMFDTSVLLGNKPCPDIPFGIVVDSPDGHLGLAATAMPETTSLEDHPHRAASGDSHGETYVLHEDRIVTLVRIDGLLESVTPRNERRI